MRYTTPLYFYFTFYTVHFTFTYFSVVFTLEADMVTVLSGFIDDDAFVDCSRKKSTTIWQTVYIL